ncbi:hypothetical protein [Sphingobium sp.]|uniref:hypothetical protein n=1 Tax=Sphingobium sp. TaxID=1912891 RepID=UPI002BBF6FC5|nr:hypothetical protein [Sphingobium sp.]HUD91475.1 hypothetical protein [Sphingobium sp.]
MRNMETRVETLEARQALAVKWHRAIDEVGEPVEATRARMGIPEGDNIFIYRLASPNAQPE